MAANPSSQPNTSEQTAKGSFAKRISFTPIYAGLEQHGIALTDEEKKKFEEITLQELRRNDGGLIGNDVGNSFTNLIYLFFAFIQNFVKSLSKNGANELGAQLSNTGSGTLDQNSLNQLNTATARIHMRMSAAGGNLARAAELVTGQRAVTGNDQHPTENMTGSIFNQLIAGINLPPGTSTSLNQNASIVPPQTPARAAQNTASLTSRT